MEEDRFPHTLKPRVAEIMRLQLLGHSIQEIAEGLGVTSPCITATIQSPLYKQEIGRIQRRIEDEMVKNLGGRPSISDGGDVDPVVQVLSDAAPVAATTLRTLLENSIDSIKARVAQDILDRRGYRPPDRSIVQQTLRMPDEQLEALSSAILAVHRVSDASSPEVKPG